MSEEKTKIISKFLTRQEEENIKKITRCELDTNSIKYLNIKLTGENDDLFKNYDETWKRIQKDMERWSK